MRVEHRELMQHLHCGLRSYSAEASELGLRPGMSWPSEIVVPGIGNGLAFLPRRDILSNSGEFQGRVYRQGLNFLELTIFND
jgi:hypothetical protein